MQDSRSVRKDPYIIIERPNNHKTVYRVKLESARAKTRFVHRKLLLSFMCLPCLKKEGKQEKSVPQETTRSTVCCTRCYPAIPFRICVRAVRQLVAEVFRTTASTQLRVRLTIQRTREEQGLLHSISIRHRETEYYPLHLE